MYSRWTGDCEIAFIVLLTSDMTKAMVRINDRESITDVLLPG
jgi:hypothetical protein